jgi:cell wall assembly regulator SMI1
MNRVRNIGIGVGTVAVSLVIILAVLVLWAEKRFHNHSYPIAPPMPAVVNETMAEILARLDAILKTNASETEAHLQPGLSVADISKLELQYHVQIPDEIKEIYEWHNGTLAGTNFMGDDFIPGDRFLPLEETLENNASMLNGTTSLQRAAYKAMLGYRDSWICLLSDSGGDGYWFDPKRTPAQGAVFYNFNEEGAYTFFPSVKNLMAGIVKCYEQGIYRVKAGTSPPQLDEDFERSANIWNEFGVSHQE